MRGSTRAFDRALHAAEWCLAAGWFRAADDAAREAGLTPLPNPDARSNQERVQRLAALCSKIDGMRARGSWPADSQETR